MENNSLAHLIASIHKLPSSELQCQTDLLAKQEHLQVARLIAHLAEVDLRKLFLKLARQTNKH